MDPIQFRSYMNSMDEMTYDAAIIGAGPTGASLALGLAQMGLQVALVDIRDPNVEPKPDGRNYAVVTGSWRLLRSLGVTDSLVSGCQPLNGLEAVDGGTHVFGQPSVLFTKDDLDSADPDEPLGQMVMAEPLQAALDGALRETASLDLMAPERFERLEHAPGCVTVWLESGKSIQTRMLIGADGMMSPVRHAVGIPTEGRDYNTSVLTANVSLSRPHEGIARQLFTPEGPFATLPLPGDSANIAWYMRRGAAETLAAMPNSEIEAELNDRFGAFAGAMRIEGKVGSYPLILQLATRMIEGRCALIGDAARRVNPLAGQGLNQGFRDVAAMLEVASETLRLGGEIGGPQMLEAYSQARRFDGTGSALTLDVIDRLFSNDSLLTKPVRTIGMVAAQNIAPLRRFLARKASATESGSEGLMGDG